MTPEDCARSAAGAGFTGDALVTIVAIAGRESGWNPNAVGDVAIQTDEWGPSVGLYQVRTLKAMTGTGTDRDISALMPGGVGDPARQSAAAFAISLGGANFDPWSTAAGLSAAQLADARVAVQRAGETAGQNVPRQTSSSGSSGVVGAVTGTVAGLIDKALGAVVDRDTFSGFVGELALRSAEVVAGGALLAIGALMVLDLLVSTPDRRARSGGIVGTVTRTAELVTAAIVAAPK